MTLQSFYFDGGFLNLLIVVASCYILLEAVAPLYPITRDKLWRRWLTNISLYVFNVVFLYAAFHALTLQVTSTNTDATPTWNHFDEVRSWPIWIQFLLYLVFFDFFQYVVHVASHRYEWLWRIHVTHHADEDIDSTTSFRHHPLEFCLECSMRIIALLVTGVSIEALILYDILLTCHTFFAHSNLRVPARFDRIMRRALITPDFHRVHHSVNPSEADTNYGFLLSIWDQLFRTHLYVPQEQQMEMQLGLTYFRGEQETSFWRTLLQPFRYRQQLGSAP